MYYIEDEEFGKVRVGIRAGMHNITMRWKGETLYMNAPRGVSEPQLRSTLEKFRVKLRASRDKNIVSYHIGQVIQCYGLTLTIEEQTERPDFILFKHTPDNVKVLVPKGRDLDDSHNKQWVSKALRSAIDSHAHEKLIPLAQEVSGRVGVAPLRFANLLFLPEELIELTICHELAHLTHMNHSPQFHALVDTYLMGREKQLEKKLKAFNWPVLR